MINPVESRRRWRTGALDAVGLIAVAWSIPLAILLVGTPIVLVVVLLRMLARWALSGA